ncbi:multiple inositol polyphosphate phosphatase 1-like [Syngnathoides biaculeatus]|uniref:multiple inositol polyphosphate phosphatase 1-like n=1 Tax=Syngnathoides biaculeatus TaxID=300417 RepID=UPI002ADD7442|nr:multiple inositol polyphosphate phosphatase 1-like [Syngnathoides biaculeatus]XP_061692594.1 multiple inositol polyphosphate phosphatase 1-like [Syngnathoides biaculeatus]XP_061692595.1 multiple inositol polyphosphate phosphatase 1-like [Syngnathoides biaculeatus]
MQINIWGIHVACLAVSLGFSSGFLNTARPSIPRIAKYFGTKGRYEEVNPYLLDDILAVNTSILRPPFPQCRPVHLTAIIRHGTRYPTSSIFKYMEQMYEAVKSAAPGKESWVCEIQDQWRMWYPQDTDGRLARKGVDDHKHLAVRLSKLFPSLLSEENLRGGFVKFITSSKHRCINSTLSFVGGLTELWDIQDQKFDYEVNDALMKYFSQCAKFVKDVVRNPSALLEVDKFKEGPEMRRVREKIGDQLTVPYNNITADMADAAMNLCAYELAIRNVNSPWCECLDDVDAQVVEYANDLRQFWKRGYGHDINRMSSCILFHDVFSRLDKVASERLSGQQVTEAVTIQVGHGETLLPLYTLLGFFKDDEPLTSSNYASQRQRSFRPSLMLPYAANLLLALYDCEEGDLRLQPLINEKPVTFPGLTEGQQSSMPLYRDVKEHYKELIHGCDFETECELFTRPNQFSIKDAL